MPDFGKQKEPLWRAYLWSQWLSLWEGFCCTRHNLLRVLGRTRVEWPALVQPNIGLDPEIQDTSQRFKWNLTFVNVKHIPSNKWSHLLLLMSKMFVTLGIFNCCKRGHSDTVRMYKEKQRSSCTLCASLSINVWTYATQCSIQQMTM